MNRPSTLAALALCAGCSVLSYKVDVRVDGADRLVDYDEYRRSRAAAVRAQAERDFRCDALRIDAESDPVYVAHGCGRDVVYVEALCVRTVGTGLTVRYVPISEAVSDPDAYGGRFCTGRDVIEEAARFVALNEAGARDLACRRDSVVATFVSNGHGRPIPLAEGCAKRATYLPSDPPYRLSSVVVASDARR
jgi:hypothetical protein